MSRIVELFAADAIAHDLGVELVSEQGTGEGTEPGAERNRSVELAMVVDDRHVGWHGRCHGGVLFTVADIAMSYLSNCTPATAFATHAAIDFLRGVDSGDRLIVTAVETARQGRAAVCDVTVRVDGAMVATFRGSTLEVRSG